MTHLIPWLMFLSLTLLAPFSFAQAAPQWTPAQTPIGNHPTFETEAYKRGLLIPLWANLDDTLKTPFPEATVNEHLYEVTCPTVEFFSNHLPNQPQKPLPVILIAPGGGYGCLAYDKEGVDIARRLRSMNCHTAVLKYRINCENAREWAHLDALRALTILKENAPQLGIDPNAIGMMGFSAGAHLTATILAHQAHPLSFAILMYPAYLSADGIHLQPDVIPSKPYVPTFVMQCMDDRAYLKSSLGYVHALSAENAPLSTHLYSRGGHGFGGRLKPNHEAYMWTSELRQWFQLYIENRSPQK